MTTDVQDTATLSERVAEEVRAMLARRRVSGRELARRLDVSPNWVSLRMTGIQPIDLNDLDRIARTLGVSIVDLLPRDRREVTVTSLDPSISVHETSPFGNRPRDGRPVNRSGGHGPPSSPSRTRRVLASAP